MKTHELEITLACSICKSLAKKGDRVVDRPANPNTALGSSSSLLFVVKPFVLIEVELAL